ncbi:hypothetical protein C5167_040656 [Papaver somniferum]|uniref:Leucine-rich repeat-containing N-terminal plant-type domain-containing protein n=1 Tax=Papaver somniferum TaxID=3469 RepID=A0A4Y7IJT6_PAPSO|nr:hypothetical protein C5167_040656 [Papaver somniferum]
MRIQHQFLLYYSLFLPFLATTTLISPSHGDLGKCHPSDFKALMKMKNSITMSQDVYSSWFQNTDCCSWIGITCDDKTNRVVEIILFIEEISGQIPPSVGDLSHLIGLTFRHFKNITGSIPQSITKLKHLYSHTYLFSSVFFSWMLIKEKNDCLKRKSSHDQSVKIVGAPPKKTVSRPKAFVSCISPLSLIVSPNVAPVVQAKDEEFRRHLVQIEEYCKSDQVIDNLREQASNLSAEANKISELRAKIVELRGVGRTRMYPAEYTLEKFFKNYYVTVMKSNVTKWTIRIRRMDGIAEDEKIMRDVDWNSNSNRAARRSNDSSWINFPVILEGSFVSGKAADGSDNPLPEAFPLYQPWEFKLLANEEKKVAVCDPVDSI